MGATLLELVFHLGAELFEEFGGAFLVVERFGLFGCGPLRSAAGQAAGHGAALDQQDLLALRGAGQQLGDPGGQVVEIDAHHAGNVGRAPDLAKRDTNRWPP